MLRRWMFEKTVAVLAIPSTKVLSAGAYGLTVPGVDTTPDTPFVIIRAGALDVRAAGRSQRFFVYAHDRQGSYATNIDPWLTKLGDELPTLAAVYFQGWYVTACEFEGLSDDLIDSDKGTAMKFGQFRVTGRQVVSA